MRAWTREIAQVNGRARNVKKTLDENNVPVLAAKHLIPEEHVWDVHGTSRSLSKYFDLGYYITWILR